MDSFEVDTVFWTRSSRRGWLDVYVSYGGPQ